MKTIINMFTTMNRFFHVLFLFLIIGGNTYSGTISGTFSSLTNCPQTLSAMCLDPAAAVFYAVGDQSSNAFYKYTISTNTWTTLANAPVTTGNNAGATYLNGKIYVAYTGKSDIQVYSVSTNSWTTLTGPTGGVYTGNISNDGTDVYICNNACLWKYVISSGTWTALATNGWTDNRWGGLCYNNGYFYHTEGDGQTGFDRYRVAYNSWEDLDNVPGGAVLGAAIYDAYYYCMGDYGGTNLYSYDLGAGEWNNTLTLPWSINDATICVYGNSLYIIQGEEGTGFTRFTPNNPMLTNIEGTPATYTLGNPAFNVTSTLVASQNAGTNFQSATVTISSGFQTSKDVLSFVNANGISGSWNSSTGVLTLTGTTTIANYQAALRSVQYYNNDLTSNNTPRIISFQVYDGSIYSNTASRTVIIPGPPAVSTADISNIGPTSATCGGNVTEDNGNAVTARGVCWNTTGNPTISDSKTTDGSGIGTFTSSITGLTTGVTCYVRAYATNTYGTNYGEEKSFLPVLSPCIPPVSSTPCNYMYITSVSTTGGIVNFSNTTGCAPASYSDYHLTKTASQAPGSNITMSFISYGYGLNYAVWIDFDDDAVFESSELVISYYNISASTNVNAAFTVPADAPSGSHFMRVMGDYYGNGIPTDPCAALSYGETEDYGFTVGVGAPADPTSVTASVNPICTGGSTLLTANGVDGTIYWYTESCGGTEIGTGNTITVSPTTTTTYYARNYNNSQYSTGCASLAITVEQSASAGTLTKTPDEVNVCEGSDVSAALTGGTGGNGNNETEYRTNDGTEWGSWTAYVSGTEISTTGKTAVEIRTRMLASYCSSSGYTTVSWTVEQTPVVGSLAKTPEEANVCEGSDVSAAVIGGTGGNGNNETEYRTNDGTEWGSWTAYVSGTDISTTGKTAVEIRTRMLASYCSASDYTTASWTVEQTPVAGSLAKTPDVATVCEGSDVSAALTGGTGGNGNNETEYRTNDGTEWGSWTAYVSGTDISTTGKTAVEIRTRMLASYCSSSDYTTVSWTVEQTPVAGSLAKTPEEANVCEGSDVSAALTGGTGGNGNDILQFRTLTGVIWSSWQTYTSGNTIATAGLAGVEIRTYREADYCSDASAVTVSWGVDPTTVGGNVTGGTTVCYGSNSTVLTLESYTGSILKWQSSVDGLSWDDIANTLNTYTATNLNTNTWFRAVVQNGVCSEEISGSALISMFTDYHISGYAKYYNNPRTPLNGLKITLRKGGVVQGSPVNTSAAGFYDFGGLTNGTYDIEISSAHPSGTWQTWNGVNNTDYLLVYKHALGLAYLASEPPVVRLTGSVVAPHPDITLPDADIIRLAAKYGWFVPNTTTPYFDIPKWMFSGTSSGSSLTNFALNCANVTRDIFGLCAGDVNGSYVPPSGYKDALPSIELIQRGILPLSQNLVFPVKAGSDMVIGAITLLLDFNPALMEITSVEMPGQQGDVPYFQVQGNIVNIGWMSLKPRQVTEGETIILIRAKLLNEGTIDSDQSVSAGFELNPDPISELADADGQVISDARLFISKAQKSVSGNSDVIFNFYPNPAKDVIHVEYCMTSAGDLTLELVNLQGRKVYSNTFENLAEGINLLNIWTENLPAGMYMINAQSQGQSAVRKIVITR